MMENLLQLKQLKQLKWSQQIKTNHLTHHLKRISKQNIAKETVKKNNKTSYKEEPLVIFNQGKDENSSEALILDTLAEEGTSEIKEEKYIPPKTRQHLSPSVRKIVEEKNIDISSIKGTGKAGRISKGDLISLMGNIPQPSERKSTHGLEERVKMTRLRVTISKRLKEAQNNAAILTTFNEVDMQKYNTNETRLPRGFPEKVFCQIRLHVVFCKSICCCSKKFSCSKC